MFAKLVKPEFLVPMKMEKKYDLEKNSPNLGKKKMCFFFFFFFFFAKLGNFGNASGQLGIFSANWEKFWDRKPDPVLYSEKALLTGPLVRQTLAVCLTKQFFSRPRICQQSAQPNFSQVIWSYAAKCLSD